MIETASQQPRMKLERLKPYALVSILGSAYLVLVYMSTRPLFGAALGPIDDHEYVRYIRHGGESPFHIPALVRDMTEVGSWGKSTRFRPTYYLLRVSGIYVLGEHGGVRYLIRVVAHLAIAITLAYALIRLVFPKLDLLRISISSIVISLAFFSVANWLDVTTRLGPSELGLNLALAALILSFVLGSVNGNATGCIFLLAVAASFLASGSKENAIWAPVLLYPVFRLYVRRQPSRSVRWNLAWLAFVCAVLFQLWISVGVAISLGESGENVYGAKISLSDIPSLTIDGLRASLDLSTTLLIALLVGIRWSRSATGNREEHLYYDRILIVAMSVVGVKTIDYVYYRGSFDAARYGLTTSLLGTFVAGLLVLSLARMWWSSNGRVNDSRVIAKGLVVSVIATTAIFALSPTQDPYTAFTELHRQSVLVRKTSLDWRNQIEQIAALDGVKGAQGILLHVTDAGAFERTYALRHFLALEFPEMPFFLVADFPNDLAADPLVTILRDVSAGTVAAWEIQPLAEIATIDRLACLTTGSLQTSPAYPCVATVGY